MKNRIAEIKERCEAATPGPWGTPEKPLMDVLNEGYNAGFVSHAREDIPYLLSQLAAKDAEIERLCEAQRWIPVSERLPDSGVHVWLCCETKPSGKKYVCDGYYASPNTIPCGSADEINFTYSEEDDEYYLAEGFYEVIKNWDDFSSITIGDFVTHWMPLPAAPEEGESK